MEMGGALYVNGGEGETSYAKNSVLQRTVITKARPFVVKTITELFSKSFPQRTAIADLGCSCGPNSLLLISEVILTILALSKNSSPEFQVFLNDLPENDFNAVFKSVSYFCKELGKDKEDGLPSFYFAGVPGSFYGRLFPTNSLLFVHSASSLHWLSQPPPGIENKGKIYISKESSPTVIKAYSKQFEKDFSAFLRSRSEEIIVGGRMVITINGRRSANPSSKECCLLWDLVAKSLRDMVGQGLVGENKLDSFNLPYYTPNPLELRSIIQTEGSFNLDILEFFDVNWEFTDDHENKKFVFNKVSIAQNVAKCYRAVLETMFASYFGDEIIDDLFHRYAEYVAELLDDEKIKQVNLVMCMTKKG